MPSRLAQDLSMNDRQKDIAARNKMKLVASVALLAAWVLVVQENDNLFIGAPILMPLIPLTIVVIVAVKLLLKDR